MEDTTHVVLLDNVVKGAHDPLKLGFYVEDDCHLTKIQVRGATIDAMIALEAQASPASKPSADGAAVDRTWARQKAYTISHGDEDEGEQVVTIVFQQIVLKAPAEGEESAMVVLGQKGETVLASQNWQG